jgi:hypothetical protein
MLTTPPRERWFSSRAQIDLGFAATYLIWGSTYLGIRYAVETIPPLLICVCATLWRERWSMRGYDGEERPPHLKQWGYALIAMRRSQSGVTVIPGLCAMTIVALGASRQQ